MSLRARLALWYSGLLSIVLAATLAFAFAAHVRAHEADVDSALHSSWQHSAEELREVAATGTGPSHAFHLAAPQGAVNVPTAIWLIDADGAVEAAGALDDPAIAAVTPAVVTDGFATWRPASGRVRSFAGAVPGAHGARIVVTSSLAVFDASLDRLLWGLVAFGAIGVAATAAGGLVLSGSALRPIAHVTDAARTIAASRDFSRRVAQPRGRDELARLATTFNEMLGSLDGAYRAQQRLVGDVSHELRTPLTTIQGNADILAREDIGEAARQEAVAQIRRETGRLARLVNDLLVLAHADAGPQPLRAARVQLDDALMEVFSELRPSAGKRLRVLALEAAVVMGERDRLKQLVLVLVDNALRYTPPPGTVELSLAAVGDEAVLRIDDSGIGIDPAIADRVFERSFRGELAREMDPSGTGLGLSIARWIAERHGAHLSLEPRTPCGTRAIVRFPLVAAEAAPTVLSAAV